MGGKERIDAYLKTLPPDKRAALQPLRRSIKAVIPKAEETISYQIPAFRLDGKILVWFHAAKDHCSFFPGAYPIARLKHRLKEYQTSKGTVRFAPDKPLRASLVRALVKARIAERFGQK